LGVCYGAGLRRQEVAQLVRDGYDSTTACLTVQGKGRKVRTVYLRNGQRAALDAWLTVRGDWEGPLFLRTGGRGRKLTNRGLSADAIYDICVKRGKEAGGIEGFSPHDLRRSAISDMLDGGADISAVAAVAGHSKIDTTARYDRRGERAKAAAAALLEV
jgi:integrase